MRNITASPGGARPLRRGGAYRVGTGSGFAFADIVSKVCIRRSDIEASPMCRKDGHVDIVREGRIRPQE